MSTQNKIAKTLSTYQRRIRDYHITVNGEELKVLLLKITEDIYGDETETYIDDHTIIVKLIIPDDIPLTRLRSSSSSSMASTENVFFYDILPIEGYARFEDHVEKGDILIYKIYDDKNIPFFIKLKVTEIIGSISNGQLLSKHFQCAPDYADLDTAFDDIIDTYMEMD